MGGLMQPVERDVSDLDPLTKIHILLNLDYAKYFLSTPSLYEILASFCPPETGGKCDLRKDAKRPGTIPLSAMSKGNTMVNLFERFMFNFFPALGKRLSDTNRININFWPSIKKLFQGLNIDVSLNKHFLSLWKTILIKRSSYI